MRLCEELPGGYGVLYRKFIDKAFTLHDCVPFVEGLKLNQLSENEAVAFGRYQHHTANPNTDRIQKNAIEKADADGESGSAKARVS